MENLFDSLIASKLKSTEAVRQGQSHKHISKTDLEEKNKDLQNLFEESLSESKESNKLFSEFFKILEATRQPRAINAAQYQAGVNEHYKSTGKPAVRVKAPNYQVIKPYTDLVNLDT